MYVLGFFLTRFHFQDGGYLIKMAYVVAWVLSDKLVKLFFVLQFKGYLSLQDFVTICLLRISNHQRVKGAQNFAMNGWTRFPAIGLLTCGSLYFD